MAAAVAIPAGAQEIGGAGQDVRRNVSAFRSLRWHDHFNDLTHEVILYDVAPHAVHLWSQDEGVYKLYPSSVPMSEELARRGYTKVVRKVEGSSWRPTPSMKRRNSE